MNRNTEYESLLRELESTPAALDGCVERAQARLRARQDLEDTVADIVRVMKISWSAGKED